MTKTKTQTNKLEPSKITLVSPINEVIARQQELLLRNTMLANKILLTIAKIKYEEVYADQGNADMLGIIDALDIECNVLEDSADALQSIQKLELTNKAENK